MCELFLLRLLVKHVPSRSFNEYPAAFLGESLARMLFASFQDTAKARGLVADDNEGTLALLECIQLGRSTEHLSGVLNAIVARLPTEPWALLVLWNSPPCSDKEPVPLQQHQPLHLRCRYDCLLLDMDGPLPMHCQGECRLWHTLAAGCECHLPAHLLGKHMGMFCSPSSQAEWCQLLLVHISTFNQQQHALFWELFVALHTNCLDPKQLF
jgi:hypothetical protein